MYFSLIQTILKVPFRWKNWVSYNNILKIKFSFYLSNNKFGHSFFFSLGLSGYCTSFVYICLTFVRPCPMYVYLCLKFKFVCPTLSNACLSVSDIRIWRRQGSIFSDSFQQSLRLSPLHQVGPLQLGVHRRRMFVRIQRSQRN